MNIPGTYPGERPILAVWVEGGHIHSCWSAWTVYCHDEPGLLLRHTEGFYPPFKTRECDLPAASYAWLIERLEAVSIPIISRPLRAMTDCSYAGVMYGDTVLLRWYGCAPEGWEGLARWHGETTQLFERVLQQALP
jgi:hypothetical protein